MRLEDEATALYGVPLEGFTARRNARAKELKGEDRELADAVARLPKPAVAAAAVNRLAREHADLVDDLLSLGDALRSAQSAGDGTRLRELTAEAHEAVRRVLDATEGLSDAQLGQVEQTLRAAMADPAAAAAVRAGVLVKPLAPAGFGAVDLAGAVAVAPPGASPRKQRHLSVVRPAGDRRRERAAARDERQEKRANEVRLAAERALDALEAAREELTSTVEAVRRAEQEQEAALARVDDARSELHQAEQQAGAAEAALRAARRGQERAERNERAAMTAAEAARRELEAL